MKIKIIAVLAILLVILVAVLCLRFAGVTHEEIKGTVESESEEIQSVVRDQASGIKGHVDAKHEALDKKLDRIESKLDRLLSIAERPLPDGLQEVR